MLALGCVRARSCGRTGSRFKTIAQASREDGFRKDETEVVYGGGKKEETVRVGQSVWASHLSSYISSLLIGCVLSRPSSSIGMSNGIIRSSMEKERGGLIMDELSTLTIWFSSYIAGMILTLLMPKLFAEPSRVEAKQDDVAHVLSYDRSAGKRTLVDGVCCDQSREGPNLQPCCVLSA